MKVSLTDYEVRMAVNVGVEREIQSIEMGLKDAYGFDGNGRWDISIEGAAAEQALAKSLGRYWGGTVNTFKKADVGEKIQVRSTKRQNGCLIVHENDSNEDYFVLVVGKIPNYEVIGYILGKDAKQKRFLKKPNERPAAYFVPQGELQGFNRD